MKGLIIAILLIVLSPDVFASNWVWVTSNDIMDVYIDTESISNNNFPSESYITCWEKWVFLYPRNELKTGLFKTQFKKLGNEKFFRFLSSVQYDEQDSVINSWEKPNNTWAAIPPDSLIDETYDVVKSYAR